MAVEKASEVRTTQVTTANRFMTFLLRSGSECLRFQFVERARKHDCQSAARIRCPQRL
jgi:hypothetical protein